ncbi:hypothetical protein KRP22_015220 [Phytophthora ramorum]|nr:Unconventional prefoldin RPB5 interactor [Phytophthora ramorum]
MMAEAANARLLQERIESVREQVAQLLDQVQRFDAVADTLMELPKKLSHQVMVPLGKRAMVPGKIVRSNEVLAHLGDEFFSWRSTPQALEIIERKQQALRKQIETHEENLRELSAKKTDVGSVAQLQKMYEDENIREIQETEEESDFGPVPRATDEDIKEYFEVEEEERLKQEQASWSWDDMMKRMEDLEAREESGKSVQGEEKADQEQESVEDQVAALKAKGNDAFARRRFQAAVQYYSQAISWTRPHIFFKEKVPAPVSTPSASFSEPRHSRFNGTNYTGQTVSLEPVGEAQPVKRVSRFKAARATRGPN